ncbi:uncharacterized protein BT62DRAFT_1005767 [Guyanagaster necrorhizus]|uniref:Uncharacterized protein n=1 Tax=Guyanagaster necrorhizus TaxID=856835 RepID=A0A9P7VV65_9AGAR|nr:uncharacterized protein BT62DRAFT_1005767 [Guyanagaster necrorhizus MCA 3950]KAG7446471.1 hypothetical protein BT62DRAFT_1005767 [Guyanagaster necrorhizus MCA 3950]
MDSPSVLPPLLPRLRVSRTPRSNPDGPQSGPSHLSDPVASNSVELNIDDEPSRNVLSSFSIIEPSATFLEDTPAARLRAVMARLPPSSTNSTALPTPSSPSERESDFDQPHFASSITSTAQESIKSIFSRARRDPGDTPRKDNRPRRNSFDVTEVQASPMARKAKQERARIISKRQSMSDEEIERVSYRSDISDADVFSVHSRTPRAFGSIRDSANDNIDTQGMVDDLGNSQATPPAATSTPQHSLQMSFNSYLQAQSNLLDHDSEMQRGLQGFESDDGGSPKVAFSTASRKKQVDPQATIRPRPADRSQASSGTSRNLIDLQRSQSVSTLKPDPPKSRPNQSSSHSINLSHRNSFHTFPKSPGHSGLTRRDSTTSINTFNDRASSEGSYTDHRGRRAELKSKHNDDLERQWDKPHRRTLSSLSQSSTDAMRLSWSGGLQRHNSLSSSRSASPASSRTIASEERDRELEVQSEVDHERERNWNSPHPTWYSQTTHRSHSSRANSPMPPSPTASTSPHSSYKRTRPRMDSKVTARGAPSPGLKVPESPRSRVRPRTYSSRSNSPLPPDSTASRSAPSRYSHSNVSISPTHSNTNEEKRPRSWSMSSKPTSKDTYQRTNISPKTSSSPSTTSIATKHKSSGLPRLSGHSKSAARTVDHDKPISSQASEIGHAYDEQSTDTDEDLPQESTPTLKTATLTQSQTEERKSPSLQLWSQTTRDESRPCRPIDPPVTPPLASPLSSPSAPPTPPSSEPLFTTPHRRSSFSQSEYQTLSPPKELPELPGPPSSGSENEQDTEPVDQVTVSKTPPPPGAWSYTPAPRLARSNPLPVDKEGPQDGTPSPENSTPLARTTSLPPQTPAPPGGWLMTPKKSVRFDPPLTESDQSGTEITPNSSAEFHDESTHSETSRTTRENGILRPSSALNIDSNVSDIPPTPVSPSKSRRTPTVNFVDEYGKEEKPDKSHGSPRNRSAIRIVDAMGREVDDSMEEPLTRTEAVTHMRQGLSQIAQGLEDVCQSGPDIDMARLTELEQMSKTSRKQREELARKLHHADEDVRRKVVSLRESMSKNKIVIPAQVGRRCPSLSWIAFAIIVQLFLILIIISGFHARDLFLTTYYDPFYAELHMYTTKPDYTINWLSPADSPPMSQGGDRLITRVLNMFTDWWWDTGERSVSWPPT